MLYPALVVMSAAAAAVAALPPKGDIGYYNSLRNDEATTFRGRSGNVDLVTDPDGTDLALCHVVNQLAFSHPHNDEDFCSDWYVEVEAYTEFATILKAMRDFNEGDGSIVSALEGINERCPVRFTHETHDSRGSPLVTVRDLTRILAERDPVSSGNGLGEPFPGAVLGARYSSVTTPATIVSKAYDLVHMSFTATSPSLNDQFTYPLFSRIVTSDDSNSKVTIRFLNEVCGAHNVAVVFVNDIYGAGYLKAFQKEALAEGMTVQAFPVEYDAEEQQIKDAVAGIKKNGSRYVFMILFSSVAIEGILEEAMRQGVAGEGYMYIVTGSGAWIKERVFPEGSPLATAYNGMAILPDFGGLPETLSYERYKEAMRSLSPTDIDFINNAMPYIGDQPGRECWSPDPDSGEFQSLGHYETSVIAPYAYDTIVAMGLGACRVMGMDRNGTVSDFTVDAGFDGGEHSAGIVEGPAFEGVTGLVKIDPATESRDPLTINYVVLNIRSKQVEDSPGNVTFELHESIKLKPNKEGSDWDIVQEIPFFFPGGGTEPPDDLPPLKKVMNYLGNLRIFGYILFAIVAILSVGLAIWVWKNRNVQVVRGSQPMFLIMICSGTLVLGSSIIPMTIDDQYFSQRACSIACMSVPWLLSVGFVTTFSALFCKTWRVNKLMNNPERFKHIIVTEKDVLKPFAILMGLNVLVLILWTVLAPLEFARTPIAGTDQWGRVQSSSGSCVASTDRRGGSLPYLIILAAINFCVVILANIQAYQARNIHTEYSESRYIALVNGSLLQAWLTGLPILVIVYSNPKALFVVGTLVVFLTSMAVLLLIFGPKLEFYRRMNSEEEGEQQRDRSRYYSNAQSSSFRSSDKTDPKRILNTGNTESPQKIDGSTGAANDIGLRVRFAASTTASGALRGSSSHRGSGGVPEVVHTEGYLGIEREVGDGISQLLSVDETGCGNKTASNAVTGGNEGDIKSISSQPEQAETF